MTDLDDLIEWAVAGHTADPETRDSLADSVRRRLLY